MRVAAVRSYLDSGELALVVQQALGVPELRLVALSFGVNDFYRIEGTPEPLVLRVSPANRWSREEVAAELALLRQLESAGVAVGCPRSWANGDDLITIHAPEGERPAAMFRLVKGPLLTDTEADAADLGAALARLHLAGEPRLLQRRLVYDSAELVARPLDVIAEHFGHLRAEMKALEAFASAAIPRLDRFGADTSLGVVHGDVQLRNAIRSSTAQVALIDFDECGRGWAVDDMAIFLMLARGRDQPHLAAAFLHGYEAVRTLSEAERDIADVLVRVRAIWAAGWQLRMHKGLGPAGWFNDEWFVRLTSPAN
jgi:Ser/Thr protein kinase RdoA (MazF antagonist)